MMSPRRMSRCGRKGRCGPGAKMNLLTSRWSPIKIVFCIEPVGTFTACTTNVMPKSAMIAVTTSDSKYSRQTLRIGPVGGGASAAAFFSARLRSVLRAACAPFGTPSSTAGSSITLALELLPILLGIVENTRTLVKSEKTAGGRQLLESSSGGSILNRRLVARRLPLGPPAQTHLLAPHCLRPAPDCLLLPPVLPERGKRRPSLRT